METNKPDPNKVVEPVDTFTVALKFPFNYNTLDEVKTRLEGRKWLPKQKYWIAARTEKNIQTLQEMGFSIHPDLLPQQKTQPKEEVETMTELPEIELSHLLRQPYNYQKQGIRWLEDNNGRGLLADEMGLGKTMQALGWLSLHLDKLPVIIVCPASLKYNWLQEIEMTIPDPPHVEVLNGKSLYQLRKQAIYIINYDILPDWVDHLILLQPKILITDECHQYKNNKAQRTKAVKKLQRRCKHFIPISGTPITNRPIEFYNVLQMLQPTLFANRWEFAQRYCGARHNGFGWDFSGATNTQELHERINGTLMLRRKKPNVLKDLPIKTWAKVPVEINNRKAYDLAEADFVEYLKQDLTQKTLNALQKIGMSEIHINKENISKTAAEQGAKMNQLVELEKLKQIAVEGKLDQAIKWIWNFLESGEKLVIFATHIFVIDRLMKEFKGKVVKIDGSVPTKKRQAVVRQFQEHNGIRLFIGNIQAAGVGITLTAASNVLFLEFPWTPGELDQAIDRVHRIGQMYNVTGYCLVARNTVDDKIIDLLDKKRQVLNSVLDGQRADQGSILGELLDLYKK